MSSRRSRLEQVGSEPATNAGLWLDKYIKAQDRAEVGVRAQLIGEVAGIRVPDAYHIFFAQWRKTLQALKAHTAEAEVRVRMVVGLGAKGVAETSIQLHHTYGVPFIPGSALKGLAAAYARQCLNPQAWAANTPAYQTLFGDTTAAGYVTFYDALYVPDRVEERPLRADVLTVHHRGYYEGKNLPPADWDSPTPVPFLSATGRYLIAIGGQAEWNEWVDAAFTILSGALAKMGVGAKTSSGYGRLTVLQDTLHQPFPATVIQPGEQEQPPSIESEVLASTWHDGVVTRYKQGKGQVRDLSGKLYSFGFGVLSGNYTPRNNDRVQFQVEEYNGEWTVIHLKKRR